MEGLEACGVGWGCGPTIWRWWALGSGWALGWWALRAEVFLEGACGPAHGFAEDIARNGVETVRALVFCGKPSNSCCWELSQDMQMLPADAERFDVRVMMQ